jgi:hypothetical protein
LLRVSICSRPTWWGSSLLISSKQFKWKHSAQMWHDILGSWLCDELQTWQTKSSHDFFQQIQRSKIFNRERNFRMVAEAYTQLDHLLSMFSLTNLKLRHFLKVILYKRLTSSLCMIII